MNKVKEIKSREDVQSIFRTVDVQSFVKWAQSKYGVKLDQASISRQRNGKQEISKPWRVIYGQFLLDQGIILKDV